MKDIMADSNVEAAKPARSKKRILVEATVRLADGTQDVWTKDTDPTFTTATVLEGNVLGILGDQGEPLRLYQPMFWLTCDGKYEDAE